MADRGLQLIRRLRPALVGRIDPRAARSDCDGPTAGARVGDADQPWWWCQICSNMVVGSRTSSSSPITQEGAKSLSPPVSTRCGEWGRPGRARRRAPHRGDVHRSESSDVSGQRRCRTHRLHRRNCRRDRLGAHSSRTVPSLHRFSDPWSASTGTNESPMRRRKVRSAATQSSVTDEDPSSRSAESTKKRPS
jgi:hypothetical protein